MSFKPLLLVLSVFVLAFSERAFAQGYLIPNGVYTNLFAGEIDVWNPGDQITGFIMTAVGKQPSTLPYPNIFEFDEPLTYGVRVFLVSYNSPITLQTISSGVYPELQFEANYTFGPYGPFYLAFYTGNNFAPPYPPQMPYIYNDPDFGWAEIKNVNGVIEVLNSAVEYGGTGIFAGTTNIINPVPEPATWALLSCGLGLLTLARLRKK